MRIMDLQGEEYDLPDGFDATFTRYNPMFSDKGDQTLPLTLPATPKNVRKFGYANRLDNWFKPVIDYTVLVQDGFVSKKATLSLNSCDFSAGISATIYFNQGDFYSRIDGVKMAALNWGEYKHPDYENVTLNERRQWLINLLRTAVTTPATDDLPFGVCMVATSTEYTLRTTVLSDDGTETWNTEDIKGLFILNCYERYKEVLPIFPDGRFRPYIFEAEREQKHIVDSNEITIGIGYGMTPFLKLKFVLSKIFSEYGYSLDMTEFISEMSDYTTAWPFNPARYDNILLLNTVADAIYGGRLEMNQLVPDVLIADFLKEVSKNMAGNFFIDEVNMKAKFRMFKNVLIQMPSIDLSQYKSSLLKPNTPEFKKVSIIDGTETDIKNSDDYENIKFEVQNDSGVEINFTVAFPAGASSVRKVLLTGICPMICLSDSIINKNSGILIDGESQVDSENTDSNSKIQFIIYTPEYENGGFDVVAFELIRIHPSWKMNKFSKYMETALYEKYGEFKEYSNIAFSVGLNIPKSEFFEMSMDEVYLMDGNPCMVESMKGSFGKDPVTVEATMRTVRKYV